MSSDSQPAMTYPTEAQYKRWKKQKDALGYNSMSQFMQDMVEAGIKKFDATVEPDETNRELREQRNDLKAELDHARDRIGQLEDQLHRGERAAITEYVEDNPGATFDEIIQHIMDTVPQRVTHQLEALEGETVRSEEGAFYPTDGEGTDE